MVGYTLKSVRSVCRINDRLSDGRYTRTLVSSFVTVKTTFNYYDKIA